MFFGPRPSVEGLRRMLAGIVMPAGGIVRIDPGETFFESPITKTNMAGTTNNVAKVKTARPPITASPSGAVISLPSSRASAMGIVPNTIAPAVMRMAQAISAPRWRPRTDAPARQWSSMKVDSSTELDTETPMHMIEPMNDSMFSVVPVASK